MKVQVNKSRKQEIIIIYHPNPPDIQKEIDEIIKIAEGIE